MSFFNYCMIFWIVIFASVLYCQHHTHKHCTKVSSIQSEGLFKIVAFIPVNNEYPEIMNSDGILLSEVLRFVINEFNAKCGTKVIGYIVFDTCSAGEFGVTTEGLLQILINDGEHENVLQNNSNFNADCRCVVKNNKLSYVIGLMSTLSSKTAYINKLLSYHRLPLVSYSSTSTELSDSSLYPYLYRTIANDKLQAKFFIKFLLKLNWTFISLINSDDTYGRAGAEALLSNSSICSHLKKSLSLPANDLVIRPVMKAIRDEIKSSVVVLWGHSDLVKIILEAAVLNDVVGKTWIISESMGLDPWFLSNNLNLKGDVLVVIPNGGKYEKFENYFLNLTLNKSNHNPWLKTFFNKHGLNRTFNPGTKLKRFQHYFPLKYVGFVYSAVNTYLMAFLNHVSNTSNCDLFNDKPLCTPKPIQSHTQFADHYIKTIKFKDLLDEEFQFDENGDAKSGTFELHMARKDQNRFELISIWSSLWNDVSLKPTFWRLNVSKKTSKCSEHCKAGFFSVPHGKATVKQCCWECAPCLGGTIKPYPGKGECTACPDTHSNNDNSTECIQLLDVFIEYDGVMSLTIIAISILGVGLTCCVIAVFIVKRNTRIVRSANFVPSLLQLIIHNLIFILPYLFFDEDTSEKCIVRTFSIGLFFTLLISITISKVSILSMLFRLKHRMNDRERNQMKTKQIVIIFVPVLLQICIMIILMSIHPIKVQRIFLKNSFKVHNDCDVSFHLTGQLLFLTVLQALCCIKGFLARKLPNIFNETKYISFSMFTSLLVMLLSVPLIDSYRTWQEKNFVLVIVIQIANLLILLIMYSNKMYIIFCGIEKQRISCISTISNQGVRQKSTDNVDSAF